MKLCASVESEWIAVYLFSDLGFESIITELVGKLVEDPAIASKMRLFFYIRYWEGGPHVRLRILPTAGKHKQKIIDVVEVESHRYFSVAKKSGSYQIEFCEYKRETQRYGGAEMMNISEGFFKSSSQTVMKVLQKYSLQWSEQLALGIAIKMHAIFANTVVFDIGEIRSLFGTVVNNWILYAIKPDNIGNIPFDYSDNMMRIFKRSFEVQMDRFGRIFDSSLHVGNQTDWEEYWRMECLLFRKQIDALMPAGEKELIQIYDSHIHMTNNRLGIRIRDEAFIAFVLSQLYEGISVANFHPTKISIA